jgi:hypothetical protein
LRTSLAIHALALVLLPGALACTQEAPSHEFPGMRLLARVEARLERERSALRPMLEHYGLVFPVEPGDLDAFMQAVRVHGHGRDLALGDTVTFTGLTSKYAPLPNVTAMGSFDLTPNGGGTVTLVAPSKITARARCSRRRASSRSPP